MGDKLIMRKKERERKVILSVSSPNLRVTNQQQVTSSSHNATTYHAHVSVNKKFSTLEKAQKTSVKTENLPDGRIRYYAKERPSAKSGPTRGSSYVTEYNSKIKQVRSWIENYNHDGSVNRIHPKTLDGQDLKAQHYPPIKSESKAFAKKPGGP
jgi:filamentous hemagglutinin